MHIYQCQNCEFSFSEADNFWDAAINLDHCPKCSALLKDFPSTKPEHVKSIQTLRTPNGTLLYMALILIWAISAFTSSAIAMLSVNKTIISIILLANIVSLIVALILAFKQKTEVAFIVAFVPPPAIIGLLMAYIYVSARI